MKKQRGITLIALVITIVVLIILAGVAINLTLGENGIFTRAQEAKLQYEIAQAKEELDLKIAELQVEKQGSATLQDVVDMLKDEDMNYVVSLTQIASITGVETIGDASEIYVVYKIYQFRIYDTLETEFISIVDYENDDGEGETPTTSTYTVTLSGSNVTSNGATQVNKNESYTATITPAEGYGIATLEVKMGGTTLTQGTHYTYTDGILTIGSVTGNINITVTTEKIVRVTALINHTPSETPLTYSWSELEEVANVIANNPTIITNNTIGAHVIIGTTEYTVGIGDLKEVSYNNTSYTTRILGFNHDTLTTPTAYENENGTTNQTAGISFEFLDSIMKSTMEDISNEMTNNTGWSTRILRKTLNEIAQSELLENSTQIKQVQKTYLLGNQSTDNSNKTSDYLWALSCSEIWTKPRSDYNGAVVGLAKGSEGTQYKYYKEKVKDKDAKDDITELVKNYDGTPCSWWLRSPYYKANNFICMVMTSGCSNAYTVDANIYVAPGFAI